MSDTEAAITQPTSLRRFLQFPLTRIVLALAMVVITLLICQKIQSIIYRSFQLTDETSRQFIALFITLPAVHCVYLLFVKFFEKRDADELSFSFFPREFSKGVSIGAFYLLSVVAIIWMLGHYQFTGKNNWTVMLPVLAYALHTRYVEEIIARGIIFRISEERLGSWLSALLLSILFGILHLTQTDSTIIGAISVGAAAGFFMSAVHMTTRKLWTTIGLHSTWYFAQVGIFGHSVSGHESIGLIEGTFSGSHLITGAMFGIEFSVVAAVIGLFLAAVFIRRAKRTNRWIPLLLGSSVRHDEQH